jgi:hypothetical protein
MQLQPNHGRIVGVVASQLDPMRLKGFSGNRSGMAGSIAGIFARAAGSKIEPQPIPLLAAEDWRSSNLVQ